MVISLFSFFTLLTQMFPHHPFILNWYFVPAFLDLIFCLDLDSAQLKKKFYRIVDSDETSAGINLRKIEAEVFATYKNSITREMKQKWTGSPSQHSYADLKIISVIKKSLAP